MTLRSSADGGSGDGLLGLYGLYFVAKIDSTRANCLNHPTQESYIRNAKNGLHRDAMSFTGMYRTRSRPSCSRDFGHLDSRQFWSLGYESDFFPSSSGKNKKSAD